MEQRRVNRGGSAGVDVAVESIGEISILFSLGS